MGPTASCPCGSDEPFGRCCLPLHLGERQAETAEQLMRARYSAYAVDNLDYVWQTWHPRTRPLEPTAEAGLTWTGLEIVDTAQGLSGDESGEVEFRAHYVHRRAGQSAPAVADGTMHERSRFAVRARRWFYVDGEVFR
ncbi:YchJ family protein [Mycolicibacterium tusciae]|uniref:YchJ family protein n=1 Tax=Mycolicibacterium tusciae TaxID=75922 RepID=UPI00024A25C3|nr:YchJ family metal-binding protein [Mycolicibacterium tusciae]